MPLPRGASMPFAMAEATTHARSFEELRPTVLARLMEVRSSLDHGLARLEEGDARAQLESIVDHIHAFLATGDRGPLRGFLRSVMTMRAAEGLAAENLLHAVVGIGDVCVQVVDKSAEGSEGSPAERGEEVGLPRPGGSTPPERAGIAELVCALTHTNAVLTRLVVELIADELARRLLQRERMAAGSES